MAQGQIVQTLINWETLGSVRLKKLLSTLDPTDEATLLVNPKIEAEKRKHNETINNTFEVKEGQFTKFEFVSKTPLYKMSANANNHEFGQDFKTTTIYVKPKSMIIFQTEYQARVQKNCLGRTGTLLFAGGKNHNLEEVFFSKVSSVQATHVEAMFQVIKGGCFADAVPMKRTEDGFTIRAGENFAITSEDANEINSCRKLLNSKLAEHQ